MAESSYEVVPVDEAMAENTDEPMGTKRKFWFVPSQPSLERCRWLFKFSQAGTGQDWAEKLACELAEVLAIPHARVELAEAGGQPGCIVKTVIESAPFDALEHGNQVLYMHDPTYPKEKAKPAEHTVERVLRTLDALTVLPPRRAKDEARTLSRGSDWFVGYLLLDALIGNTDRHHENWAVLQTLRGRGRPAERTLSASFDHGSSMGRELRDEERAWRLKEGWASAGVVYAQRARSGIYQTPQDRRPLHPVAAFALAAKLRPEAGLFFQSRLRQLSTAAIDAVVARIPAHRSSAAAKRFTSLLLQHNHAAISALDLTSTDDPGTLIPSEGTAQ